ILRTGFQKIWDENPIPRNDVHKLNTSVRPRLDKRLLDAPGALGLVLHFLNSTMADFSLEQIFGLTPAVSSHYRNWGLCILQETL
ncbi:hypothetical protein FN846DRAFT_759034, partial [Sphaerosporella brunnea]